MRAKTTLVDSLVIVRHKQVNSEAHAKAGDVGGKSRRENELGRRCEDGFGSWRGSWCVMPDGENIDCVVALDVLVESLVWTGGRRGRSDDDDLRSFGGWWRGWWKGNLTE